jgi:hypothetical protein
MCARRSDPRTAVALAAIAVGHVTATDFDRRVRPKAMGGPARRAIHALRIALDCRS